MRTFFSLGKAKIQYVEKNKSQIQPLQTDHNWGHVSEVFPQQAEIQLAFVPLGIPALILSGGASSSKVALLPGLLRSGVSLTKLL
jgi:hypothetical protein